MSSAAPPSPASRSRLVPRLAAAVCVGLPLVLGPWVSLYNRLTPRLGGIPFFYWSQLAWILLTGVLCALAALLLRARPAAASSAEEASS